MRSQTFGNLPKSDLQEIVTFSQLTLEKLMSSRILICGGTGFIGTWLTSALLEANSELKLQLNIVLITRDIENAKKVLKVKSMDPIEFVHGDLGAAENPFINLKGSFSHIVHAATSTVLITSRHNGDGDYKSTVLGASRLVDFSLRMDSKPTLLHLSSGAVYGVQPIELGNIPEGWINKDLCSGISSYGRAKLDAEKILCQASNSSVLRAVNPRLFTFYGPNLPLNGKYAIGNFLHDALTGKEIFIKGNPNTRRSYMYPTDLIEWVIKCLIYPSLNPLHIGSDKAVTMAELGECIALRFANEKTGVGDEAMPVSNYVPGTLLTSNSLGVSQRVNLEEGITRWINWLRQ